MVTYFNRKDLVSFGNYLLSEERKVRFEESYEEFMKGDFNPISPEEAMESVHHAEVENWIESKRQD